MTLYIFWFLHQTTTVVAALVLVRRCISFDSYIKPQLPACLDNRGWVVYLLIPTSNHNHVSMCIDFSVLYIFWFLHQTTTLQASLTWTCCCISFDSYIKPQLTFLPVYQKSSCISFDSYIKPQLLVIRPLLVAVVYLLIPTSNHNRKLALKNILLLYIFWFLHQTTTCDSPTKTALSLYIFWFLHQTTTVQLEEYRKFVLYIFWFLHQTTTMQILLTVYNLLYIFWFLHQTTTVPL